MSTRTGKAAADAAAPNPATQTIPIESTRWNLAMTAPQFEPGKSADAELVPHRRPEPQAPWRPSPALSAAPGAVLRIRASRKLLILNALSAFGIKKSSGHAACFAVVC